MAKQITIDATGKAIGRVASETAQILRGKDTAAFERNIAPDVKVKIINASKVNTTEKKLGEKYYKSYSGFPGGQKKQTMKQVVAKKGYAELFRKAVHGMLPGNKLRPIMMKNLTIEE